MGRTLRTLTAFAALAWVAACGLEPTEIPSEASRSLDVAAKTACDDATVVGILDEIYSNAGLQNKATTQCANVFKAADKGPDEGLKEAFKFVGHVLDDYEGGKLSPPAMGGTLEEALTDLFDALFVAIGLDPPGIGPGDVVVETIDENGGTATVPSGHAAIQFAPGDLTGDTYVILNLLPDPDPGTPGGCPFGFPVPNDCYPLFYSYTLVPETNLVGTPILGQCVVEPPDPDAPPNATVEARLRIASEDHTNPGTLIFWPLATAPSTVNCSDLALGPPDWRDDVWAALGPLQDLFRVTPAYANPGRLGASVSTFSPFAAVDPAAGTMNVTVVDAQQAPFQGATVTVLDPSQTVVASGSTDPNGEITFTGLPFDTYQVNATSGSLSAGIPVILTPTFPTATFTLQFTPVICTICIE